MALEVEVETDADTGDEILYFVRRKKPYLYLRDRVTKRFIMRLMFVELRVFMVVDYSVERARKGNPLYIDAVSSSNIEPKEFPRRETWEWVLERALTHKVAEEFGWYVAHDILELAGIEYGSEPKHEEKIEERKYHYVKVWKHHPEEAGEVAEGTEEL